LEREGDAVANTYAKMVAFFGAGRFGWQEEWYWQTDLAAGIAALIQDARIWATARKALLSNVWNLEAIRYEVVDAAGNSASVGASLIGFASINGGPGTAPAGCTNPWLALATRWYSAQQAYARNLLLRGMPDAWTCPPAQRPIPFVLPNAAKAAWDKYVALVKGTGSTVDGGGKLGTFQFRVRDHNNGGKATPIAINDVSVIDGKFKIQTAAMPQIPDKGAARDPRLGDQLHVHNVKGAGTPGINGDGVIVALDNATFTYTLSTRQQRVCPIDYLGRGTVWGVGTKLVQPVFAETSRITARDTGGPFFGTRGRSRKRACSQ
jgi:hypothetical protein